MTSPYRQAPYETNAAGPSRIGAAYERVQPSSRAPYTPEHGYVDISEHPHNVVRRTERASTYYTTSPSEGYYVPPPADGDARHGRWARETSSWYGAQANSAPSSYAPRRPSPPPVHTTHPRTYDSPTPQSGYPSYPDWRAASPPRSASHWDDRRAWESARDDRMHDPQVTWRQTRPETGARISNLLNPKSPSPPPRGWCPSEVAQDQHQTRTFTRSESYTYEYRSPAPQAYYDAYDARNRYPDTEHYRPHYGEDERVRSRVPTYSDPIPRYTPARPPAVATTRPSRPSALGDYKRQRHVSPPRQTRQFEVTPTSPQIWNKGHDTDWDWDRSRDVERERQISHSDREVAVPRGSFSSPGQPYTHSYASEMPRSISTASNPSRGPGGRDILNAAPVPQASSAPLVRPFAQRAYDVDRRSNSDNASEDGDSDVASSRASDVDLYDRAHPVRGEHSHGNNVHSVEERNSSRPYTPVRMLVDPHSHASRGEGTELRQLDSSAASVRSVGTPAGRSGVMSVHQLLTPTPERPSTARSIVTSVEGLSGPRVSPTPSAKSSVLDIKSLLTADEPPSVRQQITQPEIEGRSGADASTSPAVSTVQLTVPHQEQLETARVPVVPRRSPLFEAMQLGLSTAATPITPPEMDGEDKTLTGDTEPARSSYASPKPAGPPSGTQSVPPAQIGLQPRENVILKPPPRERPDAKMIAEALKKVVLARNILDKQSREERVNPILMANLSLASPPPSRTPTSPEALVGEFQSKMFAVEGQELRMNTRAVLAARFAEQRESLSEKRQRLRNEYIRQNRRWKAHCAALDAALRANVVEEAATTTGRTTRRSAATLGDAVRSDLEMEQIIASLGNEDMTDPNHLAIRNVATIPDMISVERGHVEYLFDDTNGFVDDPESFYDARTGFHDWTEEEKAIYLEKYAEYPKQFWHIARFLPNKTASQCVLYYYIHKKRLIDFRGAVNAGTNRRRRGGRRAGKQKGNALIADIQGTDREKPAGGRRKRGGAAGEGRGGRRAAAQTEATVDGEVRPRRRRGAAAKAAAAAQKENEGGNDVTMADGTENQAEAAPPPKRQARKPRRAKAAESPAPSPAAETKFIDVNETLGRRKPAGNSSHWSDTDKEEFLRLLAQHGRNFKRIASSMPNKTTVQVQNFFKNHMVEMDLDRIASTAQCRSQSPEGSVHRDPFVNGSHLTAPSSAAPTPPIEATPASTPVDTLPPPSSQGDDINLSASGKSSKRDAPPGPPGVGVMMLNEPRAMGESRHIWMTEEFPFVHANTPGASRPVAPMLGAQPQVLNQKAYMSVLHPSSFQTPGSLRAGGIIMSPQPTPIGWQTTQAHAQSLAQAHAQGQIPQGQDNSTPSPQQEPESGAYHSPCYSAFRAQVPSGVLPGGSDKKHVAIQPAPIRPGPINAYPFPIQPNSQSPHLQHPHAHPHPIAPHLAPRTGHGMPGSVRDVREGAGGVPVEFVHHPKGQEQGNPKPQPERSSPFTRNPLERGQ